MSDKDKEGGTMVSELRQFFEDHASSPELVSFKHPTTTVEGAALVLPKHMQVHSIKNLLEEYRGRPDRRKGWATAESIASLIELANRSKDEDSIVFASEGPSYEELVRGIVNVPRVLAILNYNQRGGETLADAKARFGDHVVEYQCALSDEWQAWSKSDGQEMNQGSIAAFLEDRLMDLADASYFTGPTWDALLPRMKATIADPARIIEVAQGIEIHSAETVLEHVKLPSGETKIQWQTEHKTASGAPVEVPGFFGVRVPVFRYGEAVSVLVRLRYRINNGRVVWYYQMYRRSETQREAFRAVCDQVAKGTSLPLVLGRPERQVA